MNIEGFLNRLKTLSESLMAALPDLKHEIAKNVFLYLKMKVGKIVKASLKEPFAAMDKLGLF